MLCLLSSHDHLLHGVAAYQNMDDDGGFKWGVCKLAKGQQQGATWTQQDIVGIVQKLKQEMQNVAAGAIRTVAFTSRLCQVSLQCSGWVSSG